jgi:uncharacterized tellurite resistance protein B-like protein
MPKDPLLRALEELVAAPTPAPEPDQVKAAVAVLAVQVLRADREVRHDEHRALSHALQRVLGLDEAQADALVRHGEDDVAKGVAFADVIGVLRRCGDDVRKKVVHTLWRVAFADAELAGQEEYLVRKVAEHLGLTPADLVETKLRAREEFLEDEL